MLSSLRGIIQLITHSGKHIGIVLCMFLLITRGQFLLATLFHNVGAIAINTAWVEPSKQKIPELKYASEALNASATLYENSPSMWRLTAFVAAELNQPTMTIYALRLSNQDMGELLDRAEAYFAEKRGPDMLKWARIAQAGYPNIPISDLSRAFEAYIAEDWEATVILFPENHQWDDHNLSLTTVASAWSMLGDAYRHQKQYTEALAAYDNALEADPTHYVSLMWSGNLNWHLFWDQDTALALWQAAAISSPSSDWAYQRMARHYVEMNRVSEACQMASDLLNSNPGQSWAIEFLRSTNDC